jgi:CheY-like chemotaxis protein
MKKSVVIVEDNKEFAGVLTEYIESFTNFEVVHFVSAIKALDYIHLHHFSIAGVVSDILMREMDGIDFVAHLRESKDGQNIPFIFLSGTQSEVFNSMIKPYNVANFLEKPVDLSKLVDAMEESFDGGSSGSLAA